MNLEELNGVIIYAYVNGLGLMAPIFNILFLFSQIKDKYIL